MANSDSQKLADSIGILEKLKEAIDQYASQDVIEELSRQADRTLTKSEKCILRYSKPSDRLGGNYTIPTRNFSYDLLRDIRYVIELCRDDYHRRTESSSEVSELIHHLKKVQCRLENEDETSYQGSDETKADSGGEANGGQTGKTKNIEGDVLFKFTPDFKVLEVHDTTYKFTKNQAIAMKLLHKAWKDPNKVGVDERDIGKAVDSVAHNYRLMDTFRQRRGGKRGYNPAWNELIENVGNHIYRLRIPKQNDAKSL